jgi:hypothetical protein
MTFKNNPKKIMMRKRPRKAGLQVLGDAVIKQLLSTIDEETDPMVNCQQNLIQQNQFMMNQFYAYLTLFQTRVQSVEKAVEFEHYRQWKNSPAFNSILIELTSLQQDLMYHLLILQQSKQFVQNVVLSSERKTRVIENEYRNFVFAFNQVCCKFFEYSQRVASINTSLELAYFKEEY